MGILMGFTKTISRYKRELKAGWSSQRPSTGTHKDRFPFSARRWSLHGLFMVFAKTMLRYKRHPAGYVVFQKTIFRRIQRPPAGKKKRAATRTAFSDYQGNSSTNQLIQLQITARNCALQISAIYLADSVCVPNTTTPLFCADLSRPSIASASSGSPRTRG